MEAMNRASLTNSSSNFTRRYVNKKAPTTSWIVYELWPQLSTTTWKKMNINIPIFQDRQFWGSKQVLEGKAKRLRQDGKGKRPNKSRSVTSSEETELWEQRKLGNHSPQVLIQTIWWLSTRHFGLRGRQGHHTMQVDENGAQYVEFVEIQPKLASLGSQRNVEVFYQRCFQQAMKGVL